MAATKRGKASGAKGRASKGGRPSSSRAQKSAAENSGTADAPAMPDKVPQPHGGALLTGGVPGNKGGTGRPPNWLREWCDDLLASENTKTEVEAILKDRHHPAFATMWKAVGDRAHGKPKEHIEHSGTVTLADLAAQAFTGTRE